MESAVDGYPPSGSSAINRQRIGGGQCDMNRSHLAICGHTGREPNRESSARKQGKALPLLPLDFGVRTTDIPPRWLASEQHTPHCTSVDCHGSGKSVPSRLACFWRFIARCPWRWPRVSDCGKIDPIDMRKQGPMSEDVDIEEFQRRLSSSARAHDLIPQWGSDTKR